MNRFLHDGRGDGVPPSRSSSPEQRPSVEAYRVLVGELTEKNVRLRAEIADLMAKALDPADPLLPRLRLLLDQTEAAMRDAQDGLLRYRKSLKN